MSGGERLAQSFHMVEGQTQVPLPSEPSCPCLRFSTSLLLSFYFPESHSGPLVQKHSCTLPPFFFLSSIGAQTSDPKPKPPFRAPTSWSCLHPILSLPSRDWKRDIAEEAQVSSVLRSVFLLHAASVKAVLHKASSGHMVSLLRRHVEAEWNAVHLQSQLPRWWGRRIACSYKLETVLCGIVRPLAPERRAQEIITGLSRGGGEGLGLQAFLVSK